jgi:hypothetical protein
VLSNPLRTAVLVCALALVGLSSSVASASAAETSQITSPASPTYAFYDETVPSPPPAFTVEGTTSISGTIALRCYYGATPNSYTLVVKELTPSGGAFSAAVQASSVPSGPCVLRAVPVADNEAHPPGTESEEATDPYKGPRIVGSRFELYKEDGITYDYEMEPSTLGSYLDIESVGDCGLTYSSLLAPETLAEQGLFDCNATLYQSDDPPSGPSHQSRSELQIDGANAYGPATARYVNNNINRELELKKEPTVSIPGAPQITVTHTFDPVTRLATIHEVDPIVRCAPETVFPPTATSCTSFVSTGVQLERTWRTSNNDQVAWLTDTWHSTDGAAHSLNALYDQETVNAEKAGGAYEFPGSSSFATVAKGQTVTLPSGTGRIYYKQDAETPNVGDGLHPQGAIVYDSPPNNGPISVYRSTEANEGYNGFEMPYARTISPGGSSTIRMAFVQAYKLSEVESVAEAISASYSPKLSIASPANGTTVTSPSVTVSGTAVDTGALSSLTVNGLSVSVGSSGAWSTSVTLSAGANTITAVATDQAGLVTSKAVSVTYAPPPPPPPVAHASQVGSVKGANGKVSFTVSCTGTAGTSCEVESTLTTAERTRNGKPVAVAARHHPRIRSTTVTVGSSKLTIPAGQKVTITLALNATGSSLLAHFGRLPVHLSVVLVSAGHRSTVIAQNLTITPHHKAKRHHRRHHHHH